MQPTPRPDPNKRKSKKIKPLFITDLKLPELEFVNSHDVKQLTAFMTNRKGTNDLYRLADKIQLQTALSSVYSLQAIYESLRSGVVEIEDIDQLQKLVGTIKASVGAINQTFKSLNIDAASRPEEQSGNNLMAMLNTVRLDKNEMPMLQHEYIMMQEDIKKTALGPTAEQVKRDDGNLSSIKMPIKSYEQETFEGHETSKDRVVDMDTDTGKRHSI